MALTAEILPADTAFLRQAFNNLGKLSEWF